jgi:F420-non-reducing hydrogenase iron-sulfur subunit
MLVPSYILRAFEKGADGVLVTGWHIGECHYLEGNEKALKVIEKTKKMLKLLGIEEERLRKEWISASEGSRFAETVRTFTEDVKRLGRNPLVKRETAAWTYRILSTEPALTIAWTAVYAPAVARFRGFSLTFRPG